MKKYIGILLAVIVTMFAFAACGAEAEKNEIADLYEQGYTCTQSSATEEVWKGVFTKEDSFDSVMLASATMTSELYEKYIELEDTEYEDFITHLEGAEIKDITDVVPSEDELNKYVGKKIQVLVDEGFENTGNTNDEEAGIVTFFYDGPQYCVQLEVLSDEPLDFDDLSNNDIQQLVISKIELTGLGSGLTD